VCIPNGSGVTPRIQSSIRLTLTSTKVALARSSSLGKSQTGRLVGLRMGLRYEQICIEWCQDALRCWPASAVAEPAAIPARRKPKAV
jgi:hypothetical protein